MRQVSHIVCEVQVVKFFLKELCLIRLKITGLGNSKKVILVNFIFQTIVHSPKDRSGLPSCLPTTTPLFLIGARLLTHHFLQDLCLCFVLLAHGFLLDSAVVLWTFVILWHILEVVHPGDPWQPKLHIPLAPGSKLTGTASKYTGWSFFLCWAPTVLYRA